MQALVSLSPGRGMYVGRLLENTAHAHHLLQISVALDGAVGLQTRPGGRWRLHGGFVTAADQLHRIHCEGWIAQLYLDPEGQVGRRLACRVPAGGVLVISRDTLERMRGPLCRCAADPGADDHWERAFDAAVEAVAPSRGVGPSVDPRVARAIGLLWASAGKPVRLAELADEARLSAGRLAHLFSEQVGLPVRRYALWLRLVTALDSIARGERLTAAAHRAGFSDSAHLSRTFRRMFGVSPSTLRAEATGAWALGIAPRHRAAHEL